MLIWIMKIQPFPIFVITSFLLEMICLHFELPWALQGTFLYFTLRLVGQLVIVLLAGLVVIIIWINIQSWIIRRMVERWLVIFYKPTLPFYEKMAALDKARPWADLAGGEILEAFKKAERST